jgi:hypothetical protein
MSWTQALTGIVANGALLLAVIGAQAFWIARALDALRGELHRGFDGVDQRLERVEGRLDRVENVVLRDHGERIARLEAGS